MGTHGVKIKTKDYGKARWLTSDGGLTTKLVHAALATPDRAEMFAKDIEENNHEIVEWARAEAVFK